MLLSLGGDETGTVPGAGNRILCLGAHGVKVPWHPRATNRWQHWPNHSTA